MTDKDGDVYLDDTFGNSLEPMVFEEYLQMSSPPIQSNPAYFDSDGFDAPILKESNYMDIHSDPKFL